MAVYKNYYNRRTLSWTVMVSCLYLLCSTAIGTCSLASSGEKLRHHHLKSQMEFKFNDAAKAASLGCPNCLLYNKHDKEKERIESDKLRLEAIKKQILQKLGLSAKPNVTHSLPREVVLETLNRAEEGFFSKIEEEEFPTTSEKFRNNMETVDVDDFYGRTSEIISFAEQENQMEKLNDTARPTLEHDRDKERTDFERFKLEQIKKEILKRLGLSAVPNVTHSIPREVILATLNMTREDMNDTVKTPDVDDSLARISEVISFATPSGTVVNNNRLLEFQVSPEAGSQIGQDFKVREATLWLKADLNQRGTANCRTNIHVFKVISNTLPESVTLSSKQFDRLTSEPVSVSLEEKKSGWQKIDLTDMVRTWLSELSNEKLRLLVDCSCCAHWHMHLFNQNSDTRSNANRPFLVIHTDPSTAKRKKRRAIDCSVDSGNQCCKQRFYVSFKALGWEDWVIAPQGYYANYCRGDCGHHRTPDTFLSYHTHVIEEVRRTQHLSGMTPCCAPLKFSSMSLIYYGPESTIIKRDLPKMVVDECGCP